MATEYAVGFYSKPHFGAPFAPLTKEEALRALPSLRRKWADAVLIVRDHPSKQWRRATSKEGA